MYPKILPEVRGGAQRAEGSVVLGQPEVTQVTPILLPFFAIHKGGRFAVKASLSFSLRLKVVPLHKDAKDITSGWRTPPVYSPPWW